MAEPSTRTLANPGRAGLDAVRTRSAKAEIAAKALEPAAVLALLRQAMSETGLSQKAMAIDAGIAESVLSEALNGRRHFAAAWWWAQNDRFLLRFLELVMAARHLTPEHASALRRKRIVELVELLLQECA